jgi:hypothetical protein
VPWQHQITPFCQEIEKEIECQDRTDIKNRNPVGIEDQDSRGHQIEPKPKHEQQTDVLELDY